MVYTISQIACIGREWPPFMQWHRIWLTPSYIEYIALTTAVPFNTGQPSAVSRSRQLKAALQVFSHYKVPLTFRYSWKRLRKRHSKNHVLQYVHRFEKNNTYWLNESWETGLPKRLKCTIIHKYKGYEVPVFMGFFSMTCIQILIHIHYKDTRTVPK